MSWTLCSFLFTVDCYHLTASQLVVIVYVVTSNGTHGQ